MRLDEATWPEVRDYLLRRNTVILPAGSTEQHGPVGLIGTDRICAEEIALRAAGMAGCLVAPALAYGPAPFNMAFPGTVSLSAGVFSQVAREVLSGLQDHGFRIFVLNGHGANLEPLREAAACLPSDAVAIRSWWDFEPVNRLRREWYGDWEGMHATPSEVAITQATTRVVTHRDADTPPRRLSADYIRAHAGDRHGPPDEHRKAFPDGRVGSHSALARPEQGAELLETAARAVAETVREFDARQA